MMEGGGDRGPTPEKLWREEPIWPHSEEEEGIGGAEWSEGESQIFMSVFVAAISFIVPLPLTPTL